MRGQNVDIEGGNLSLGAKMHISGIEIKVWGPKCLYRESKFNLGSQNVNIGSRNFVLESKMLISGVEILFWGPKCRYRESIPASRIRIWAREGDSRVRGTAGGAGDEKVRKASVSEFIRKV